MGWLKIASIVLALVSAGLWFWSAITPAIPVSGWSGISQKSELEIKKNGRINAWAAATTGLSVFLSAISDMIMSC